ncbi:MAG: transposase [Oceanospirillaceae bacterium]|nr:transposase [Oceanospirillaceae bacterium]
MKTRGQGIVGYNVQTAVDAEHHLIVAHEVTNEGTDRRQLTNMSIHSREVLNQDNLTIIADRGYFRSEEILASYHAGFRPLIPKTYTSNNVAQGRFASTDFTFIASDIEYLCPVGERLRQTGSTTNDKKIYQSYTSLKCKNCHIKTQCTTGKERRIRRWEHEEVLDDMQARLEQAPESMKIVEHPFGTIKAWMGATHLLTRTAGRVSTEMSLHILAYKMKKSNKYSGNQQINRCYKCHNISNGQLCRPKVYCTTSIRYSVGAARLRNKQLSPVLSLPNIKRSDV